MIWVKRILLMLPLATAAGLTVSITLSDRLQVRSERIAGYGFLFGSPWAWLLDRVGSRWFAHVHNLWLQSFITYAVVLWIPALLYSSCLWLLMRLLESWERRAGA